MQSWSSANTHARTRHIEHVFPYPPITMQEMIGAELEQCYRTSGGKQERGEAFEAVKERARAAFTLPAADAAAAGGDGAAEAGEQQQRYDATTVSMALKVGEGGPARGCVVLWHSFSGWALLVGVAGGANCVCLAPLGGVCSGRCCRCWPGPPALCPTQSPTPPHPTS